jgi:hypothetical protein
MYFDSRDNGLALLEAVQAALPQHLRVRNDALSRAGTGAETDALPSTFAADVRELVVLNPKLVCTERDVACIFHALPSQKFPIAYWSKNPFWGRYQSCAFEAVEAAAREAMAELERQDRERALERKRALAPKRKNEQPAAVAEPPAAPAKRAALAMRPPSPEPASAGAAVRPESPAGAARGGVAEEAAVPAATAERPARMEAPVHTAPRSLSPPRAAPALKAPGTPPRPHQSAVVIPPTP